MNIEKLKSSLGDFAKDIRLNLSTILTEEGAPELSQKQIFLIALGCAYTIKNNDLISAIIAESQDLLVENEYQAAQSAATIMAMNNIYYRFIHLVSDADFKKLPAKLRMNIIANPGIHKTDFELICLAISAINGCGMCMDAHTNQLQQNKISHVTIQSTVRIAAVLNATATALSIS